MPDDAGLPAEAEALVAQIVHEAHLPTARARDDLRRELAAHFEDALAAGHAADDVVARFGRPDALTAGLRRAHQPWRPLLYAAKVAAAVVVSAGIALPVQAAAHLQVLRVGPRTTADAGLPGAALRNAGGAGGGGIAVTLTPWFPLAVHVAFAAVLLAVAAWELDVTPACRRLERHPARLAAAVLGLFATSLAAHAWRGLRVDPAEAFAGAAAVVAGWAASLAVAARADRVLLRLLGGAL